MTITLNHTIIPARDKEAAASLFAQLFGLSFEATGDHSAPVRVNETLTLLFDDDVDGFESHHYAFHINERWLGPERDPHDLLITYPSEPMTMWPISTRVNSPDNDDPSLLNRSADALEVWAPLRKQGLSMSVIGTNLAARI